MSILRAEIPDLEIEILSNSLLNRQVPLLGIAGAGIALYAENTLSQTGIRIRRAHLRSWSVRKQECGIDIVLRLLTDGLHKRELRRCKRCRDAGLLEVHHSVPGPDHPGVSDSICQAHSRTEIAALQISRRMREL